MTPEELAASATNLTSPPDGLSDELQSLWYAKANQWDAAHDIAQEIHTPMGSWIHALLHLIEGDVGNAGYWFSRANRPRVGTDGIDTLWTEIATQLLSE